MQNNISKLKNFKLLILQNKYKYISNLIYKLTNHIIFLENNYLIDQNNKNIHLGSLYDINKNLNSVNNNYLLTTFKESTNIDNELKMLFKQTNLVNEELLTIFTPLINYTNHKFLPFIKEEQLIKEIIKKVGYPSICELLNLFYINDDLELNELLLEIENIFCPISMNFFKVDLNIIEKTLNFFWRKPKKYNENDLLELSRELWIKNKKEKNYYIKIEGIFKIDTLSTTIKTCQVKYNILYEKKKNILKEIENINEININSDFINRFLKFDYIGNLYSMKTEEYIDYIINSHNLHYQLIKLSFINIMKNFISNSNQINSLYSIIFLLLLGNDDNCDIASLLIGVTKEKKFNSPNIYNLILKRLPFFLQLKLKKSNNNIKNEVNKIKSIRLDDIDYKSQIIANKDIPQYIKNITLEKVEEMKNQNNEFYKQKTFVDHILKYPWTANNNNTIYNDFSNNTIKRIEYLNNIKNKLNNLTFGHQEAKNILLQTIANWISNPKSGGRPLGFVGPPGVGKTLLAKSISKALDIPFAEITLGGQNDGELLHGHGYTYSGSQPGLIIKKMVEMGKERCILYFDELDKTSTKHGTINEISSILIHLTDPNMNKSFQDRFFQGVDFPLDKVIMIFSYNDSDKVDPILLDRLCEIKVKPYTIFEKIIIIKDFVIPELKNNIGINEEMTNLDDETIKYIIENYTSEAGIRNIKRKIEKIFLTLNLELLLNKINSDFILTKNEIKKILLNPITDFTKINDKNHVGIINGLYATSLGDGGIISIQVFNSFSGSTFDIKFTGKQGDVMKESVQCSLTCALNYIKNNLDKYNIKDFDKYLSENFKNGFHVHAPSTSTPKDGPSAGCAFTCAFISRILGKKIINTIGMTGEIELTGKITKIGGLEYKLIGAKKAGVKHVFIPNENKEDLDEIIKKNKTIIDNNFKVESVDYIDDLIDKILIE
jgi:endopeptidase La